MHCPYRRELPVVWRTAGPLFLLAIPFLLLLLRHGYSKVVIYHFFGSQHTTTSSPNRNVLRHQTESGAGVTFEMIHGQEAVWEMPKLNINLKAVTIFGHGCYHSGGDLWPPQPGCPSRCIGLPEEIHWRRAMLSRGHMVIGISSQDRIGRGCWFEVKKDRGESAARVARTLIQRLNLTHLPIFATGVSGGAFMAMNLPFSMPELAGIYALVRSFDIPEKDYNLPHNRPYPPIVFLHMALHDPKTAKLVSRSVKYLQQHGRPAAQVIMDPQPPTVEFLTARADGLIDVVMASKIVSILDEYKYLSPNGMLKRNMRPVTEQWAPLLTPHINNLTLTLDKSVIGELFNVAFARHEFVHDYADAIMEWLENKGVGGQAELDRLVEIEKKKDKDEAVRWKREVTNAMKQHGI